MSDQNTLYHETTNFGRAFAIGIVLNVSFVLIEAIYGWRSGSLALLADAGHNLSDVGGLLLAWGALAASRLRPNDRHTYGWRRGSIIASFLNATILLVTMCALMWEAIQRLQTPSSPEAMTVIFVAGIGVVVNASTAWLFVYGSKRDLNIRGAFLHMAADALLSLGVVLSGFLYLWLGWKLIDPIVSLVLAVFIIVGTWPLFRQSLHLMLEGVPEGIDVVAVRAYLQGLPEVIGVHDLHVWGMDTSESALTAHLVLKDADSHKTDALIRATSDELSRRFEIRHVTLQMESKDAQQGCVSGIDDCTTGASPSSKDSTEARDS